MKTNTLMIGKYSIALMKNFKYEHITAHERTKNTLPSPSNTNNTLVFFGGDEDRFISFLEIE